VFVLVIELLFVEGKPGAELEVEGVVGADWVEPLLSEPGRTGPACKESIQWREHRFNSRVTEGEGTSAGCSHGSVRMGALFSFTRWPGHCGSTHSRLRQRALSASFELLVCKGTLRGDRLHYTLLLAQVLEAVDSRPRFHVDESSCRWYLQTQTARLTAFVQTCALVGQSGLVVVEEEQERLSWTAIEGFQCLEPERDKA
jgi:hypothetical protein